MSQYHANILQFSAQLQTNQTNQYLKSKIGRLSKSQNRPLVVKIQNRPPVSKSQNRPLVANIQKSVTNVQNLQSATSDQISKSAIGVQHPKSAIRAQNCDDRFSLATLEFSGKRTNGGKLAR